VETAAVATDTTVLVQIGQLSSASPELFIEQDITLADMTDNAGTATGYVDLTATIPAKCQITGWTCNTTTAWTGDVSAAVTLGIAGATDAYSSVITGSCFTAIFVGSQPKDGVTTIGTAAVTIRVTVTSNADFTSITAGASTIRVYYINRGA